MGELMINGKVVKILSNFYYVKNQDDIIECKAQKKIKGNNGDILVGDNVSFELIDNNKGNILSVCERKNELLRPRVANVDKLIIIFSMNSPSPDYILLDKQIIYCLMNEITPVICISKIDNDIAEEYKKVAEIYKKIGYSVYPISSNEMLGIDALKKELSNSVCVFAGNSGVGKSTLVNTICNKNIMEAGAISKKISRGKQTTRHVEIIECDNFMIVDTPGFSLFDVNVIKEDLPIYFEEFKPYSLNCEYRNCLHIKEEKCGVKEAVKDGAVSFERYERYKNISNNI